MLKALPALLILSCTVLTLPSTAALAADPSPNILIITADNLGYGDLQMYNKSSSIPTPSLDQLAAEGVRLTNYYTASPTCTVSRACLLTGRIPQRHGLVNQLAGVKGNYGIGLNPQEQLIPQLLKTAPTPYVTGCFGKWNIGFAKGSRPTERGFDEFAGHASGNIDYFRHNYRERHDLYAGLEELHREGQYSTDIFADAAAEFIRRHSDAGHPWFCYVPFNAPHFPSPGNRRNGEPNIWQAPDRAFRACGLSPLETDPELRYKAVVHALDEGIGRVLEALDNTGAADNTFVFFFSDNGAFRLNRTGLDVGVNTPLRHGGVTCWEGGIRVAAVARWPEHIRAGTVIAEPCWSPDLMIACMALAGAQLPESTTFDGKNLLPMLTRGAPSPHQSLFFQFRGHAALRQGEWKIVREKPNDPWQLFRLTEDIGESHNLAQDRPDIVKRLQAEFTNWQNSF